MLLDSSTPRSGVEWSAGRIFRIPEHFQNNHSTTENELPESFSKCSNFPKIFSEMEN